ncbi:MAG: ComEC/Rec2 family competence protein, partial [Eubacterium sp.]|nr:ComEC/Rec2 family competence protein [Eubacterium sp.]
MVLLVLIIGWILCLYDPPDQTGPPDQSGIRITACIGSMSGSGDDMVLTVKDVRWPDGRAGDETLLVYPAGAKFNSEEKCSFSHLQIGQTVSIYGDVRSFRKPGNPGQFNEAAYYHSLGIDARMFASEVSIVSDRVDHVAMLLHNVRGFFRDAFYQALPEEQAGTITAMVMGDKSGLSRVVADLYRENGLAHVLAISGLHVSLIGIGLFELLRKYILPMRVSAIVTGVLLVLYGQLTGFSLPTRRAVIMTILVLLARLLGEHYDALNSLCLAAVIELICHPDSLYQSGFLLSYGTVAGILFFVRGWESIKFQNRFCKLAFQVLSGSMGITLVTLPILVQSYHEIAVYSVLVNTLLLPALSLLLGLALLGGGMAIIGGLYRICFGMIYAILCGYQQVCELVVMLPYNTLIIGHRSLLSIVIYYLGLLLGLRLKKKVGMAFAVFVINLFLFITPVTSDGILPSFSRDGLYITNLDVGQGDCCCIQTPEG